MDKLSNSPLSGKSVVITRSERQSAEIVGKLKALGAVPVVLPLVAFAEPENYGPFDEALDRMEEFDWVIFTSENAVRAVVKRVGVRGTLRRVAGQRSRAAAVGPTTAAAAEAAGFSVAYQAKSHSGASLAQELGEQLRGQSVFLPRSDRANPDLPGLLLQFGARVTEVTAYRTVIPMNLNREKVEQVRHGHYDAILFFSPTAVEHFLEVLGEARLADLQSRLTITAIGPVTAAALGRAGVKSMLTSPDVTADAVADALLAHFGATPNVSATGVREP